MRPQMHNGKTQGAEQQPLPAESQQIVTPHEKRAEPLPTLPRRWIGVLLSIIGILLPLAAGFLASWPWYRFGYEGDFIPLSLFLWIILSICVGAALLRSWRAVWIVPIVFTVGEVLTGNILQQLIFGWDCTNLTNISCPGAYSPGWSAVQAWLGSRLIWEGLAFSFVFMVILFACAAPGAWAGVSLSNWLEKRRQQP